MNAAPGDFPGGHEGSELTVEFTVLGRRFVGLNGGPNFKPNESVSFMVVTESQEETDRYWNAISANGGVEAMVKTWAGELNKTKVRANLINPGPTRTRTRMRAEAYPGEDPLKLRPPEEVTESFVRLAMASDTRHGEIVTVD